MTEREGKGIPPRKSQGEWNKHWLCHQQHRSPFASLFSQSFVVSFYFSTIFATFVL